MKKFKEFNINEQSSIQDYYDSIDEVRRILKISLNNIQKGGEDVNISVVNSTNDVPIIGKRSDYLLKDNTYSHYIIGVKYFFGNSAMIEDFNSIKEFGEYLISIDNKIESIFDVEKRSLFGDYFVYLLPVNNKMLNIIKSSKNQNKFNL